MQDGLEEPGRNGVVPPSSELSRANGPCLLVKLKLLGYLSFRNQPAIGIITMIADDMGLVLHAAHASSALKKFRQKP